jgi:hypothetical protein
MNMEAAEYTYMLGVKVEQRVNVKFLAKLGKFATETYGLLMEVYGDEYVSRTQVFVWFKRFKEGRGEIEEQVKFQSNDNRFFRYPRDCSH